MGPNQELKWLALSLYPLSFFLYSPFNSRILLLKLGRSKCTVNPFLDQREWKLETAMFRGTPCFNLKTMSSKGGRGCYILKENKISWYARDKTIRRPVTFSFSWIFSRFLRQMATRMRTYAQNTISEEHSTYTFFSRQIIFFLSFNNLKKTSTVLLLYIIL